ncbi:MAG: alpha/beta hydrolase [Sedimentisphaerales bacterium]|nr:alpha/beta hydrolase [Sedimentisphaerales bacterium]
MRATVVQYEILAFATGILLLGGPAAWAAKRQKVQPAPKSLPGSRAEIYKRIGDVELPIHIFEPANHRTGDKRPAIVFFFGGGWRSGSPAQFEHHCRYLAARGMVAMTAEYRVLSRHGVKAVSCFRDAKSAMRWVRANAERLGIDPDRLAAGGGSAGGHLAGALGTIQGFDEEGEDTSVSAVPNALVLFNPALVLAPIEGQADKDWGRLDSLEERMGVPAEQLSPYHHVRRGQPPTIIFHGREDTTVPYFTSARFAEKMNEKGNRCELIGYPGQAHGFFNYVRARNQYFVDTVKKMDTFLASLGYLHGPDRVETFLRQESP